MFSTAFYMNAFALLALGLTGVRAQAASPEGPSSKFDSSSFNAITTEPGFVNGGSIVTTPTVGIVTEATFASAFTTCFVTATGTYPQTTEALDADSFDLPPGAECMLITHQSSGGVEEQLLYTIASDGSTHSLEFPSETGVAPTFASASSSSSSSKHTGTIVGAVIGSLFGTILVGATLVWIRRQRRSSKAAGTWFNRPAGWVQDEKPAHIEMTRRSPV